MEQGSTEAQEWMAGHMAQQPGEARVPAEKKTME